MIGQSDATGTNALHEEEVNPVQSSHIMPNSGAQASWVVFISAPCAMSA